MADKNTQVAQRPLSKQDARDLIKIVEGRFEQLHKRVMQRELELATTIRAEVYDAHAKAIEDARKEFITLGEEAFALERRFGETIQRAQDAGLKVDGHWNASYRAPRVDVQGVESIVRQRIAEMRAAGGKHKLSLHEQEQQLRERITIASLTGEKALNFLNEIPSIDEILPISNGNHQAIEATIEGEEHAD